MDDAEEVVDGTPRPAPATESIAAVIDALAAERGQPRSEIIRAMIAEIEGRIAVDRAVIALLRRLERNADPASGPGVRRNGPPP